MRFELEGTQGDLDRLSRELARRFPDVEFRIEPVSTDLANPFADRPLGELAVLTALLVFLGTKIAENVIDDIYAFGELTLGSCLHSCITSEVLSIRSSVRRIVIQ